MKHLIFFTSQFPFGQGETFIENELPFLAKYFEKIWIVTNDTTSVNQRSIPQNAEVIRISGEVPLTYKLKSFINFFNPVIQNELRFVRKKLNFPISKTMLSALFGSYAYALYTLDLIGKLIKNNALEPQSVVLYSYWMSNVAAGLALFKLKNPEVTAICRAHGWDVYFERHNPPYLPLRRFILETLDFCCCISSNGKQYLQELTNVPDSKIVVSRLGTFNKEGKQSGYNTDKLSLVSCSNIIPLKRIHLIVESLALISDINIDWTHFGTGSLESEIKTLAEQKLSSSSNIKYHFPGQLSNPELLSYYSNNKTDLFINVSETEGLPVSIMEVGSFGIPVIATNVGGVSEIIHNDVNGFLLDANATPAVIAEKIKEFFVLSAEKKSAMRSDAFNEWQKNFNADKNYPDFIKLISKV